MKLNEAEILHVYTEILTTNKTYAAIARLHGVSVSTVYHHAESLARGVFQCRSLSPAQKLYCLRNCTRFSRAQLARDCGVARSTVTRFFERLKKPPRLLYKKDGILPLWSI